MKFIFIGLIIGAALAAAPFSSIKTGDRITPAWHGFGDSIDKIHPSPLITDKQNLFFYPTINSALLLQTNGSVAKKFIGEENERYSFTGDRTHYISFQKVGDELVFKNISGDKFWVLKSTQYPYLSYSGKLVLLQVSDLHTIFIYDKNGTPTGAKRIDGRMATSIVFSNKVDAAIIGYMSSECFVLNGNGDITAHLKMPEGSIVKSVALSSSANFALIHYGDIAQDKLLIYDLKKSKETTLAMESTHHTRTGLAISDTGEAHIIDGLYYRIVNYDGETLLSYEIEPQIHGHADIVLSAFGSSCSYRLNNNRSALYIFSNDKKLFLKKEFDDPVTKTEVLDSTILAAGTKYLSAWTLSQGNH